MHLKRKDSIKLKNIRKWMENLRTSENGWREKYQSCLNSPSTLACCQNPMGLEKLVWHKLSFDF